MILAMLPAPIFQEDTRHLRSCISVDFFFINECNKHTYVYKCLCFHMNVVTLIGLWDLSAGILFMTIVSDRLSICCKVPHELWSI